MIASQETASPISRSKVFVSYSRSDSAFVDQLAIALDVAGLQPLMDRDDIAVGEEWKARLLDLILACDAVAFILSDNSARSEICAWELREAISLGKRVFPIAYKSLDQSSVLPELSQLNHILFWADDRFPGSGFGSGLSLLVNACHQDLDWVRTHTKLGEAAKRWIDLGKSDSLLLAENELRHAQEWLSIKKSQSPGPTVLQEEFIAASEAAFKRHSEYKRHRDAAIERLLKPLIEEKIKSLEKEKRDGYYFEAGNTSGAGYRFVAAFDSTISMLKNLLDENGAWHPITCEQVGVTGAHADYIAVWKFPCCGTQVGSDNFPSQFRADGCRRGP